MSKNSDGYSLADMAFGDMQRPRARLVRWESVGGKRVGIRVCKETGTEFPDINGQMDFRDKQARSDWLKRRMRRGLAAIDTAMRWRRDRSDKKALADLCSILSMFIDEDKKEGRPSW